MIDQIIKFDHNDPIHISKSSKQITPKCPKSLQTRQNCNVFDGKKINFRAEKLGDDDGDSSPPLWKTNSQHFQGNFQNLSPDSRVQAIARGQKEMMEMVKNMPESCYELTLKDIVDHQRIEGSNFKEKQRENVIRRSESGGKMARSSSSSDHNGGLLLKMVFPVSIMGKKKKKSEKVTKSKILPRPYNSDKSPKNVEKDWWKKRMFSGSISSESGSVARARSSRINRSYGRKRSGCLCGYISMSFLSKQNKKQAQ